MCKPHLFCVASLLVLPLVFSQQALAQSVSGVWPEKYTPLMRVNVDQAQIVIFRLQGSKAAAHIYVDSEFQSSLRPAEYTAFCLPAGRHTIESYFNDAPTYRGKSLPEWKVNLKGGKTYFLRVMDNMNGKPQPIRRADAEKSLGGLTKHTYTLSRASTVSSCHR